MAKHIEVIARGVLFHHGLLLLCRETVHDYHYLPGGHVEFGESAARALEREFTEESGLTVTAGPLLMANEGTFKQDGKKHHEINLVFHVEHPGDPADLDNVASLEDIIAFEWVDLAAITDLDLRPDSTKAWLATGGLVSRNQPNTPAWISDIG